MTHKQFRHDLRRGLGSCPLALERCGNLEQYRDDVLWGVRYALAYDAQCEGTRAPYLFDMIERFDDWSQFRDLAAETARRSVNAGGRRFDHCAELLALMCGAGYAPARESLNDLYECRLSVLRRGRPTKCGVWPAMEQFDRLCVYILRQALQTQTEREAFFLRVEDDGRKLRRHRGGSFPHGDMDWFEYQAAETLGKERVKALLAEQNGASIAPRRSEEAELVAQKGLEALRRLTQEADEETAQSLYDRLCSGEEPGELISLFLLQHVNKRQGRGEVVKLTHLYAQEERENIRRLILLFFRTKNGFSAFEDDGIDRLLQDAENENAALREEALRVLDEVRSDRVRDYAERRLERNPKDEDARFMLMTNFCPGDGKRLVSLVKSFPRDKHNLFMSACDLIKSDGEADRELSAALLPYMLREGYCSRCRLTILELMQSRALLTPEIIEACRYDCNSDVREFAENAAVSE